jgi:hypothetical protein
MQLSWNRGGWRHDYRQIGAHRSPIGELACVRPFGGFEEPDLVRRGDIPAMAARLH